MEGGPKAVGNGIRHIDLDHTIEQPIYIHKTFIDTVEQQTRNVFHHFMLVGVASAILLEVPQAWTVATEEIYTN